VLLLILYESWAIGPKMAVSLPVQIHTALRANWPHVRVHILEGPITVDTDPVIYSESHPPNLSTLQIQKEVCATQDSIEIINRLIVSSPNLESLSLNPGFRFSVARGKIPPLKNLALSQSWLYSADEVAAIWDFSCLTKLTLGHLDLLLFAKSVKPEYFPKIRDIVVFQEWHGEVRRNAENGQPAGCNLFAAFINQLPELEARDIRCTHPRSIVKGFILPQPNLRRLSLKRIKIKGSEAESSMKLEDIEMIRSSCPQLKTLDIGLQYFTDSDMSDGKVGILNSSINSYALLTIFQVRLRYIVEEIARFRNLRTLVIEYTSPSVRRGDLLVDDAATFTEEILGPHMKRTFHFNIIISLEQSNGTSGNSYYDIRCGYFSEKMKRQRIARR